MNVIEALVVTLGLDASKFKKGSKDTRDDLEKTRKGAEKAGKDMEASAKKTAEAFTTLRREIAGMLALFTAGVGLEQFIAQTVNTDAATGRLAKNIGVATEELSAWQGVLRRNGGSVDDANAGLQTFSKAFQDIQLTGQSSLIPYLNLLKISLKDLNDPSETLLKIADAFHGMDPRRAAAIGQGMGLSPAMVSLLEKGRAAVQAQLAEQEKIGVVSEKDAQAAQQLQNTLSSLKQASERFGNSLLTALEPALNLLARALGELAENRPLMLAFFGALTAALIALSLPLTAVVGQALLAALPFIAMGAAIGGAIAVVIQAIKWFEYFYKTNAAVRGAVDSLTGSIQRLWQMFMNLLKPLQPVADKLKSIAETVGHAVGTFFRGPPEDKAPAAAEASGGTAGAKPGSGGAAGAATDMIAGFEGFLGKAKWDRNAYRAGYGSDTVTDPVTGQVTKITAGTTVSREAARADLQRRIGTEFMPRVAAAVGAAWARFSASAKAAMTSMAYNYGSLPKDVLAAARTGDASAVAAAIRSHAMDKAKNDATGATRGINAKRRYAEAAAVLAGGAANDNGSAGASAAGLAANGGRAGVALAANGGAAGRTTQTSTQTSTVHVGTVVVQTQATDANGIARDIHGALRRQATVAQANSGLG